MFELTYFASFLGGILSFVSPCVLPLVPPYLFFLGGVSMEDYKDGKIEGRALSLKIFPSALAFVFGFSTVFMMLGATASTLGQLVADYMGELSIIAGVIIIILGLNFMGVFRLSWLMRDTRFNVAQKPAGLFGAYIIGLAFAFGWTPCVGPILAPILTLASGSGSATEGVQYLAVYSAGLAVPFLAASLAVNPFMGFMARFRVHMGRVEKIIGIFLIITGILFVTGTFSELAYWLLEAFPALGRVESTV